MQSDTRRTAALEALAVPLGAFRSALAGAIEDVRSYLTAHGPDDAASNGHPGEALGAFAAGRIDAARFDAVVGNAPVADEATLACMGRAFSVLGELDSQGDAPFHVEVPPGGSLRDEVAAALRRIGRAFGAARVVELARGGAYDESRDGALLAGLEYARWGAGERRATPPLVVGLDGADLVAGGLAEFLD